MSYAHTHSHIFLRMMLAAVIFAGSWPAAVSFTSDMTREAVLTTLTPFDRKLESVGFSAIDGMAGGEPKAGGRDYVEYVFRQARMFRYAKDFGGDDWQTPEETENRFAGDCEDKAVWLYAKLRRNGYANAILVIGKYREFERKYHCWVMVSDASNNTYILDPSYQKRVWRKSDFSSVYYHPYYGYDGPNRYRYRALIAKSSRIIT